MGTLVPLYEVRFFRTSAGREPVRDWLKALPSSDRQAIGGDIHTVQLRWPLGMPLVRKMEPGLWEIRSDLPDGIGRTFFTFHHRTLFLLHGFIKKSASTPLDDPALARRRRQEVFTHV